MNEPTKASEKAKVDKMLKYTTAADLIKGAREAAEVTQRTVDQMLDLLKGAGQ